jgi:quercetin dioxygenase-like cupin family protein
MEIFTTPDVRTYATGDTRTYWKPKGVEFEVIETVYPSKGKGDLHFHKHYREATLVLQGKVVAIENVAGKRTKRTIKAGELVVFAAGQCHSTENRTTHRAVTLTFKFIGGGKRSSRHFRADKYPCSHPKHR